MTHAAPRRPEHLRVSQSPHSGKHGLEVRLVYLFGEFSKWVVRNRKYLPHMLEHSLRMARIGDVKPAPTALNQTFAKLLRDAQERGELPRSVSAER